MSSNAQAARSARQPGEQRPGRPQERWVVCRSCPVEHGEWRRGSDHRLRALGYVRDCPKAAARKRSDARTRRRASLVADSGSTYLVGEVIPGEPENVYVKCGICGRWHKEVRVHEAALKRRRGYCPDCLPWALLALPSVSYLRPGPARSAAYAKIRRVRAAIEDDAAAAARGELLPAMPFWTLARHFIAEHPEAAPQTESRSMTSTHLRHLALYFEGKPIGRIDRKAVDGFVAWFKDSPSGRLTARPGTFAESYAGRIVGTLRRVLLFAEARGWIKDSPLRERERLYPRVRFRSDRIMTADEDARLLAACGDDLELRAAFLYMADTGAPLLSSLGLWWSGVDFDRGTVEGPGGAVPMTSRLAAALRQLSERAGDHEAPVFSRSQDHLYQTWERLRVDAGVLNLTPTDVRRTLAWRMHRAGRHVEQIKAALGCGTLDTAAALLVVNRETAESEAASPRFQQLLAEQFNAPAAAAHSNGHHPAPVILDSTGRKVLDVMGAIINIWERERRPGLTEEENLARVTQKKIALELDSTDTDGSKLSKKLSRYGVNKAFTGERGWFPALVRAVVERHQGGQAPAAITLDVLQRAGRASAVA